MRNHDRSLSAAALIVEILFMKICFPQGLHLAVHVFIEVKKNLLALLLNGMSLSSMSVQKLKKKKYSINLSIHSNKGKC